MKRVKGIIKNNKGYSLIELMVVVGIVGVLAGIGIPVYNNYRAEAVLLKHRTNIQQLYNAKLTIQTRGKRDAVKEDLAKMVKGIDATNVVIYPENQSGDWCIGYKEGGTPAANDTDACIDQDNEVKVSADGGNCEIFVKETNCTDRSGCTWDDHDSDTSTPDTCAGNYTGKAQCTSAGVCDWN